MSNWDASSRPVWDPRGGENTQSFGVPDLADGADERWSDPGEPPDIFKQDYGFPADPGRQQHAAAQDFSFGGDQDREFYLAPDYGRPDHPRQGFTQQDFGQQGPSQQGFGQQGPSQQRLGQPGRASQDYRQQEPPVPQDFDDFPLPQGFPLPQDYVDQQDYPQQDRPRRGRDRDRGFRDPLDTDYDDMDFPGRDPRTDYQARNQADRAYADPEYAARMDPALRDFFSPLAARPDTGPQRFGVRGYPGPGPGPGSGPGPGMPPAQGQALGPGQGPGGRPGVSPRQGGPGRGGAPGGPARTGQPGIRDTGPGRWDTASQRPGPRSARRQELRDNQGGMRPGVVAVMAVVVVLAVVVVVVIMVTHHSSTSNAGGAPATPTPTAHPAKQATAGKSAAAGFTLTTPLVAGGYTKLTKVPADVTTDAGITSLDVRGAVTKAGGKVTGTAVSAAYQLDDGQVLAFTGFDGTFNPAKVIAGLTSLGTDETTQTAGPHGGMLECATESGSASGTVCVWATTTTVGVTEFFSSTGPETVSSQAKAASDTVNVRASVEVAAS